MHLLIDGKNLLYRGIYASDNSKTDCFVTISRMMHSYLHKFKYNKIHVFWDDDKNNLWRREIYPEYKKSDCRNKSDDISQKIIKYQKICEDVWPHMNIKQYKKDMMEADDLIYSFCNCISGSKIIISNDGDMLQIPYRFKSVAVYNPSKKKLCNKTKIDPVIVKCLDGDSSDNIPGYYGIGPKKAEKCANDNKLLWDLIGDDIDTYTRNRKLIDLSLCPFAHENMTYILEKINQKVSFDKKLIVEDLYSKHKIRGIMSEYKSIISPFKMIGEAK